MGNEFCCKGKQLADYLIKNGSKLIRTEFLNGCRSYVFENDESIEENLAQWEIARNRSLF